MLYRSFAVEGEAWLLLEEPDKSLLEKRMNSKNGFLEIRVSDQNTNHQAINRNTDKT